MPESFDDVLRQAFTGEESAWSTLFHLYAPSILGFLRSIGAPEPEDQLSETFLQAARDLHSFRGNEQQFRGWIFTIARHRVIDAVRHKSRRPDISTHAAAAEPESHRDDLSESDIENEVVGEQEVLRLLQRLNPVEREIVALRFIADLDVATVAAVVRKRPNTVVVITRRALKKLRTAVG